MFNFPAALEHRSVPCLPFDGADHGVIVVWTPGDTWQYHHDPKEDINMRELIGPHWKKALWVTILCVDGEGWNRIAGRPNAPQAAPPMNCTQPYSDLADDNSMNEGSELGESPEASLESVPDQQHFKSRRSPTRTVRYDATADSPEAKRFRHEEFRIHTPSTNRSVETPSTIDRFGSPQSKTEYGSPLSKAADQTIPEETPHVDEEQGGTVRSRISCEGIVSGIRIGRL